MSEKVVLMKQRQLRVLTYNIHKGFSPSNRHFILHQIRDALREADADILFLQEMQGEHKKHAESLSAWPECTHYEFLAEEVWPHVAYGKNAVYSIGHHGNAILSKYALSNWENVNVSPFSWASRSLLHGVIRFPHMGSELHIICVHLGLLGMERRRQFDTLCNRIEEHVPENMSLIVAGDFNDWTGQGEKRFAERLKLKEAYRLLNNRYARTFPAWMPFLQMDRIYFRGLELLSCERLTNTPWDRLSDHAPLLAEFK